MGQTQRQYDFTAGTRARSQQVDDELNNLVDAHNTLDTDVQTHKKQVDPTSTDATRDKHVANNDLKTLQDQITSNDGDISTLQSRMTTAETNISSNDSDITNLQNQITSNDSDISSLQTRMTTAEGDISSNDTDISNLQNEDSRLQNEITNLAGTGRTTESVKETYDDLQTHKGRTNNPHAVSAAQVGAYSKTEIDTSHYTKTQLNNGQLDNRYYTETEIDTKFGEVGGGMAISFNSGTTFPADPKEGYVFYRTDEDVPYLYQTFNDGTSEWRPVQSKLQRDKNTVTLSVDQSNIAIGISGFNSNNDLFMVYKNSVFLQEGQDYNVAADGISIDKLGGGTWKANDVFDFLVVKTASVIQNLSDGAMLQDGSVGNLKLHADAKVGSLSSLSTTSKTSAVNAINEVDSTIKNHKSNTSNPHGVTTAQIGAIPTSEKANANGIASLDASGNVPHNQLGNSDIVKLGEVKLAADTETITFSNIPQTFSNLKLICSGRTTNTTSNSTIDLIKVKINNNDVTYSYSTQFHYNGTSGSAGSYIQGTDGMHLGWFTADAVAQTQEVGSCSAVFPAYSEQNFVKTCISETFASWDAYNGNMRNGQFAGVALNSTNAINQLDIFIDSGYSFKTGSTFTLYGLK